MKQRFKPMLLLKINTSISNKKNHMTEEQLLALFDKKKEDFNKLDKYAVNIIQTEVSSFELSNFIEKFKINSKKVEYILNCKIYN